ncbi:hypothetical protein DSO57_1027674 [Entomophthora muscae]|uniref:Uncharacterized protein n=1 Tax=Entomophthora muscae TaxID=34485 RepID=A0ACC2RGH4_9FUNG|nr:hypothetical protein DSO57_1027674 [Entomophthora muscae]
MGYSVMIKGCRNSILSIVVYFNEIPADVGYAWVIVTASFVMQACAVGVVSGFGVFLEHYSNVVFPHEEKSKVAMIGNLAPFVSGIGSLVTGRVCQHFGVRACVVAGAVFMMAGHFLASYGTQVWHFILTQGGLVGMGAALIYVPANVAITDWFEKRRGLGAGLGAAGGGVGGVAFGQMNSHLLPRLGHRLTLQVNGCIVFVVLFLASTMVRRRETRSVSIDKGFDKSLVLNARFGWYAATCFLGGLAYFVPLYFINNYAVSMDMTRLEGGYAGSAINIGSAIGRIAMGYLGDQMGYVQCYILAIGLATLTVSLWRVSSSFGMLVVFGLLYGIPSGGYAGGFGPTCGVLFGRRQLATMMGLIKACIGIGELIGPIVAGALLDSYNDYHLIIYFTMACYGAAFLSMIATHHHLQKNPPN